MAKRLHTSYEHIASFITKDGSVIRELMHPKIHGNREQSLAEALLPAGSTTLLHRHKQSEEIYHITSGNGLMRLGDDEFAVTPGDTICIPPGTPHALVNRGNQELRLLCCSSPPYSDEDTELLAWP
jgi:mannose-6-phosphate isomerase-like protein (cupin superfamily)